MGLRFLSVLTILLIANLIMAQTPASQPSEEGVATREHRDKLIAKARVRMNKDKEKYTATQLKEAEDLYQVANKLWRSDEGKTALKTMIEKYPDINRTGCAVLYLGQMSRGDNQEQYLKQAVEKFSDCCYGNGVQVGALARLFMANYFIENGKKDEAEKLLKEIEKDYPDAITHTGKLLSVSVGQLRGMMK